MYDFEDLEELLNLIVTDEIRNLISNGERIINKQKLGSYLTMLNTILDATKENPDIVVRHALCDVLNPLSGFITIIGKNIKFKPVQELQNAVQDISYVQIDNCNNNEASITIGYNNIVELRKRG